MHFLYDLGEEDSYDGGEMEMTVHYLMDTAVQAGWLALAHPMAEVGWNPDAREYRDVHDEPIRNAFKLYAWEEMLAEPFGRMVVDRTEARPTHWLEPAWKALLSTKALLPVLWELYPRHRLLLPAYFDEPHGMERWVAKPLHGREGDNIRIHLDDMVEDVVMPGRLRRRGLGLPGLHRPAELRGQPRGARVVDRGRRGRRDAGARVGQHGHRLLLPRRPARHQRRAGADRGAGRALAVRAGRARTPRRCRASARPSR